MWWAYLHSNGTVQVKRWLGDIKDYTEDCEGNQFVVRVVKPYEANDREIAHRIANESLGIQGENNVSE
jgi:hypothetical protein